MVNENQPATWTAESSDRRPYVGFFLLLLGWIFIIIALPGGLLPIAVVLELNLVPESPIFVLAWWVLTLLTTLVLMAGGVALTRRGRQLRAQSALSILRRETAFILYLRPFTDDLLIDSTAQMFKLIPRRYEENLCHALNRIAPLIAVGRPGEKLPEIGAARFYVSEGEWRVAVVDLLQRATAVLVVVGTSKGVWWEIEKALGVVEQRRLLFFFPLVDTDKSSSSRRLYVRDLLFANSPWPYRKTKQKQLIKGREERYQEFRLRVQRICRAPLPNFLGDHFFLEFDNNAEPQLLKTVPPSVINNVLLLRKRGLDISFGRTLGPKLRHLFS